MHPPRLKSINIKGYRLFEDFSAQLGPLEVIVGSNGSGKSSMFEFLRFLRDGVKDREIPPGIVPRTTGQKIFHTPVSEVFSWDIEIGYTSDRSFRYQGELMGPVEHPNLAFETLHDISSKGKKLLMEITSGTGFIKSGIKREMISLECRNQLALGTINDPFMTTILSVSSHIRSWRFYDSFSIAHDKIRSPALVEQNPVLREDAGNLSSVLHYLKTEHESGFDELQQHLRSTIPGFKKLAVKVYDATGQVMAFWQEEGVDVELTLADLSDGTLQLLCWMVLCLQPNLPYLICIDEPDQGVHPRTLALLAGLFKKASAHTQILLATHSSYFLTQFDISQIAVMRKEKGEVKFIKPGNSKVLTAILDDFGPEDIENMHISDELEILA